MLSRLIQLEQFCRTRSFVQESSFEGVLKGALTEADVEKKFSAWLSEKESKIAKKASDLDKSSAKSKADKLKLEKEANEARAAAIIAKNTPEPEVVEESPAAEAAPEEAPVVEAASEESSAAEAAPEKAPVVEAASEETPAAEAAPEEAPAAEAVSEEAPAAEAASEEAPAAEAKTEEAPVSEDDQKEASAE